MRDLVGLTIEEWAAVGSLVQAVATVLTLAVAVIALRYAAGQVKHARSQVEEARRGREEQSRQIALQSAEQADREQRLREDQARPFVVVDFEPESGLGQHHQPGHRERRQDVGQERALHFQPALRSSQESRDGYVFGGHRAPSFRDPRNAARQRFTALFDMSHERVKTDLPMTYTVRVDLDDAHGRPQEALEYVLDLNFRYGLRRIEEKTVHDVAKSLKEIETAVKRWTQHFNGVRVWVRDEDAYLAREQAEYEQ